MGARGDQRVLAGVRGAILRGEVVPGQRLVEADLVEEFGVTRASVRTALAGLAAEGLVERVQNRGARVRVVTLDEAVAISECRMVLEGLCAARAAQRASRADVRELVTLRKRMRAAVARGELLTYSDLNHHLHQRVLTIAAQPVAATLVDRLHGQIVRHQFRLALQPGRPRVSLPEHERIVDAIAAADPVAAEDAMRRHLASVVDALRATARHGLAGPVTEDAEEAP
ncbi:MAG TPA: GntR family transcriptional regulator [Actinomycetes bacterium]|nr:GntR family transcriptional regulator [Actinomycetes bacterium]